jgi:uncharacterized membrane protein
VGTEGAISREGTLSGALAALAVAATGSGLGLFEARWIVPVTGCAIAGGLAESAVAARLVRGGPVDNEAMNLLNTAVGAGLCLGVGLLLGVSTS